MAIHRRTVYRPTAWCRRLSPFGLFPDLIPSLRVDHSVLPAGPVFGRLADAVPAISIHNPIHSWRTSNDNLDLAPYREPSASRGRDSVRVGLFARAEQSRSR